MKCKVIKDYGVISKENGYTKKLQLIEWDDNPQKFDIRPWKDGTKAMGGITLEKEELLRIIELFESETVEEEEEIPLNLPESEDEEEAEDEEDVEASETEALEIATTKGDATYEDCCEKLDTEFADIVEDPAFEFLLGKLKEHAEDDDQFIQNTMRKSRTFNGMMEYTCRQLQKQAKQDAHFAAIHDKEMLKYAIEYFNAKEEVKKPKSAPKAKATTSSAKKATKKTTTKKATTKKQRVVKPLILDEE